MKLFVHTASPKEGHAEALVEVEEAKGWDYRGPLMIVADGTHVKSYEELLAVTEPLEATGHTQIDVYQVPQIVGG